MIVWYKNIGFHSSLCGVQAIIGINLTDLLFPLISEKQRMMDWTWFFKIQSAGFNYDLYNR